MGGLVHWWCALAHQSYKSEAMPKSAVHYKQETDLGTDKGLNCYLQLLANIGLRYLR